MRKLFFWTHLVVGVVAAVVILIMSVTGVLLTYELQLIEWSDRGFWGQAADAAAERVSVDELVATARAFDGENELRTVKISSDPTAPVSISRRGATPIYLSPYSGEVLGEGSTGMRSFFSSMRSWHRWLAVSGDNRSVARAITGASNLMFLFLVLSGMYLWIPRKIEWKYVRNVALFRRDVSGKVRDFNWHNVFGIWFAVPLAFVVATAVPISYRWGGDLIYWVAGEERPAPAASSASEEPLEAEPTPTLPALPLQALVDRAEVQMDGWRSISFSVPSEVNGPLALTVDQGNGRVPQKRHSLRLDRHTAEVVAWEPFQERTLASRLRSYARFGHTGEAWGIVGQTIAGLASFAGVILVWTGIALAWRRMTAWVARKRRAETPAVSNPPFESNTPGDPVPVPIRTDDHTRTRR